MLSSPFPTRFKGIDPVRAPRVISYQPFPTALSMFSPLIQARGLLIGRSEDSWHRGSLLLDCSSSRKPSGSYPRKRRSANELIDCTFSTRYRRLLTIAHRIKESSIRTFKKEYSNYYKIEGRPVENFHDKNKITRRINVTRLHINGRHDNLVFIISQERCALKRSPGTVKQPPSRNRG